MEFKVREVRDAVLRGRKNLKHKSEELKNLDMEKVMVTESLCQPYGELDYICRKLKKSKRLNQAWFFNGRLHVEHGTGERATRKHIAHISDLYNIFGKELIDSIIA